jgi:hypothetical protein
MSSFCIANRLSFSIEASSPARREAEMGNESMSMATSSATPTSNSIDAARMTGGFWPGVRAAGGRFDVDR